MADMKTCIATVSIPGTFEQKIAAISAAGFDAIELFEPDLATFSGTTREAGRLVREHGMEVAILQPFRDFEGRNDADRATAFQEAHRKLDLMQELETTLILVCSAVDSSNLGDKERIVADFWQLGELAAARGLRVGYEALAWGRHVRDVDRAWEIVQRCNHPNIGLIVDSFHTLVRKNDPEFIRTIPGERIFFFQIADAPLLDMDALQLSRHYRTVPGKGDLDVDSVVRAVLSTNYNGPLSLEIFRTTVLSGSSQQIAQENYEALVRLINRVTEKADDQS